MSSAQVLPAGVRAAYLDAVVARDRLPAEGGVLFLPDMTLVDFMAMRQDETALGLLSPQLRGFIDEDAASGGVLTQTLLECVAADLNARVAADHLFIHANTAYQRLDRIAVKTGLDLRCFADIQELVLAIKLVHAHAGDS